MFKWFRKSKKEVRPKQLNDFIGQEKAKRTLQIAVHSAKVRHEPMEHTVIFGPPGLGKTTMAGILADEMKATAHVGIGTSIQKIDDLLVLFEEVYDNDIVFIDEIHRMPMKLEELLYTAMEDNFMYVKGKRLELPKFTLIGATTRLGDLSEPLRDRFGIHLSFEYYTVEELTDIAIRTSTVLGIGLSVRTASIIASRSRGTPRLLNTFVRRSRDSALFHGLNTITEEIVMGVFDMMGIDEIGLNEMDRKILQTLVNAGQPVGLNTLASSVGEFATTVQEVYEPYLIQMGLLIPTGRGRKLTNKGQEHMRRGF